jgi:hypothetical protein
MGKVSAKARAEAREGAQRQAAQNAERQHLQKRSKKLAEFLEACAIGLDRTSKGGPGGGVVIISVDPLLVEHGGEVHVRLVGSSAGLSQEDVTKITNLALKAHKTARPDDFTPSGRKMLLEQSMNCTPREPDAGLMMISVSPLLAELHGGEVSGRLVGLSAGLSQEDVTKIKTLVLKAHKTARPDDFTPSGRQMLQEQYKANPMLYCSIQ